LKRETSSKAAAPRLCGVAGIVVHLPDRLVNLTKGKNMPTI